MVNKCYLYSELYEREKFPFLPFEAFKKSWEVEKYLLNLLVYLVLEAEAAFLLLFFGGRIQG